MSRMQQPTLTNVRIRSTRDAHQIFYAVARGLLPITIRRLDSEERRSIVPGNVYVWEERGAGAEATGLGIERWTDGMRWSPSRVRDDFLFYHQKDIEPDESVLDARWPRPVRPRATSNASGPSTAKEDRDSDQDDGIDPEIDELNNSPDEDAKPRTMEKDTKIKPKPGANPITRPGAKKDPERLVKQTYSVHVYLPSDPQSRRDVRKWHLTAYYTQATFQSLQTVEQRLLDALKSASVACAEVPEGWFKCARTGKVRRDQTKRGYTVGMPGIQYPYGSHLPAPPSQTLPYPPAPMSAVPISPSYHHGPPGPPPGHPSHISPPPHHGYPQAAPPLPHGHAYPPFPYPPSGSSGPPPPPPLGSQSNMYYAPYYSGPEIEREHPHGPNLDYDYPYSAYPQGHGPPSPYSHPPPPHPGYPHNYPHDLPPQHHSYPPPPPPGQVSFALNERQYGYPPGGVPPTPQMTSAPPSSALPPPSPPSPPHSNHSASSSTPHIAPMSSPPIPTHRSTYTQQTLAPMAPNAGLERSPRSPYRAHPYLPPIIGEKESRDDGGNRRWRSYSYSNPHSRSMSPRDKQGELERNGKDTLATGHTAPFGRERAYTDLDVYSASSRSASTSASVSASASTRESSPDPMMSPARRKVEGMSLKAPIGPIKMPLPPPPSALPPSMQTKAQLHNESMDTEEVISGEGRAVLVTVSDVRSQPAEKGKQTGDAMDVDKATPRAVSSGPTPESRDRDSSATATPPSGLRLQSQAHSPLSPSTTSPTPSSANPKTPRSPSGMMSSALSRGMSLVPLDYLRNAQAPRRDPRDDMLLRQLTALTTC